MKDMESIQKLVFDEVGDYIEFSNNILSAKLVVDRTHEIIIRFTPEYIIGEIDELLEQNIWLNYEIKALEMLKKLLGSSKGKSKSGFTRIKIDDFIKFSRYAFEASIERASWFKDKIIESSLKKEYNKYISIILFVLNQNIILLRKIKEIEPKDEYELLREVKKIIKIGPKIQENMLSIYILIKEKSEEQEIAEVLLNETLWCLDEYSSFNEI